jgi:short-subunit dehydrogenase
MQKLTAIITGASHGLGKSFAIELAQRGTDLVLIALPGAGLPDLCSFLRKNLDVNVTCFETDLTRTENLESLFKHLDNLHIQADILINNAGLGNLSWFKDQETAFYKTQIELNTITPVLLTRMFLNQAHYQRQCYILNVGSLGGLFVVPKKQVYGATKSFINYFTRCLQLELSGSNINVTLLSPGGINTKPELLVQNHLLKGISKATIMEPEKVAAIAISGMLKGKKEIIPGALNKLLVLLNSLLPTVVKNMIIKAKLKTILRS